MEVGAFSLPERADRRLHPISLLTNCRPFAAGRTMPSPLREPKLIMTFIQPTLSVASYTTQLGSASSPIYILLKAANPCL